VKDQHFTVLGGWEQLGAANDELVRELHAEPNMK